MLDTSIHNTDHVIYTGKRDHHMPLFIHVLHYKDNTCDITMSSCSKYLPTCIDVINGYHLGDSSYTLLV